MIRYLIVGIAVIAGLYSSQADARSSSSSHSVSSSGSHSRSSGGSHSIRGYTNKNGTYVAPSHATNPNHSKYDNYATKGNVNPYTGNKGTKKPS